MPYTPYSTIVMPSVNFFKHLGKGLVLGGRDSSEHACRQERGNPGEDDEEEQNVVQRAAHGFKQQHHDADHGDVVHRQRLGDSHSLRRERQ